MISRTWHGAVPMLHKEGFKKYLDETGVKEAKEIKENRGIYVKVVDQEDYAHFFLCTVWESMEDVVQYAGSQPEIAITYPEDAQYGLISDPIVIHQEVQKAANPFNAE